MPIIIIEVDLRKKEYYVIKVRPVARPYLFDRLSIIIEIRELETKTCKQVWHLQMTHGGKIIHRHKKYPVN
jgi:hypothetical protein